MTDPTSSAGDPLSPPASARDGSAPAAAETAGLPALGASMVTLMFGPTVILIFLFGAFMREMHNEFGWPIPRIALGASIISITIMVISPIQGWLVDRFGARNVVLVFVPLWGTALICMRFLPADLEAFYVACCLLTVAALGIFPLAHVQVATTWFDRHIGLAMGAVHLATGFAAAVLPAVLAFLFLEFGWRNAYSLLGVAVLLVTWPVTAIWFRRGPRGRTRFGAGTLIGLSARESTRTPAFWISVFIFLILGMISTGLIVHLIAILTDIGFGVKQTLAAQTALGVSSLASRLITGWLLDRYSVKAVGAVMCAGAGIACLTLSGTSSTAAAMAAAVGIGIVLGAEFDVLGVIIRRYQGTAAFGRLFGIIYSAFQLGGALGVAGLGLTHARLGGYGAMLTALGILVLIASGLFLLLGPYRFPIEHELRPAGGRDDA